MTPIKYAEAFRQAEASLRLEGLDPSASEPYETLKAQVIAGAITVEEAEAQTLAHFKALAARSVARAE